MSRSAIHTLIRLLLTALLLAACDAIASPAPESPTTPPPTEAAGEPAVPTGNAPATVLPPVVLPTATPIPVTVQAPAPQTGKAQISISPNQGGVTSSVVQVTVKGSGFPAGQPVQVNVAPLPNGPGEPAQGFTVSGATAAGNGAFETAFVMPSDQPDIAEASRIKVIATTTDGKTGAEAVFVNTDTQGQPLSAAADYTNPAFGYRFTIPAGWRARQPAGAVELVGLYNPSDKSQPGAEPIIVRAMPSPQTINGAAVSKMTLEQFARVAYPAEFGIKDQAALQSLQPLQPASGLSAYQAAWTIKGQETSQIVVSYFEFNRTVNGQYYRAIEAVYDPGAKRDAEYSSIVNGLSLVPLKADAATNAARATAQQFMDAFVKGNTQQALAQLTPALRERVAKGSPSLPALLGVQNVPASFDITQAASASYANAPYVVVKATMNFGAPAPVQFHLVLTGNSWLIDQVVPLQ